jgi:hypothetical protein
MNTVPDRMPVICANRGLLYAGPVMPLTITLFGDDKDRLISRAL